MPDNNDERICSSNDENLDLSLFPNKFVLQIWGNGITRENPRYIKTFFERPTSHPIKKVIHGIDICLAHTESIDRAASFTLDGTPKENLNLIRTIGQICDVFGYNDLEPIKLIEEGESHVCYYK